MSTQYDKYYGVDFTIEQFLQFIKLWKRQKPGILYKTPILISCNNVVLSRMLVSTWSSQIARTNEIALDIAGTKDAEEVEKQADEFLDEIEILKRITPKEPMTTKEIKQQLKNALAHAEYDLVEDDNGKIIVKIDSPKIKGDFSILEIEKIADIYSCYYTLIDDNSTIYSVEELLTMRINNRAVLKRIVSNIKYGELFTKVRTPGLVTIVGRCFKGEGTPLTKEEQELLENYISYIGIQNWINLSYGERCKIFASRISKILNGKPYYKSSADEISETLNFLLQGKNTKEGKDKFNIMSASSPSIYATLLLDLGFLCLNHIKESQNKQKLSDFNYRNIDLKGIKYSPKESVKLVTKEERISSIDNELKDLKPALQKTIDMIALKEKQIREIEANTKIPSNIKISKLSRLREQLIELNSKYEIKKKKIEDLEKEKSTITDYIDANDFFKHLRNSISHGFYKIDYREGLKRGDLGKIVFHFEDWEIDKDNRSNRRLVFQADITANKLTSIFEELQERILNSASTMSQQVNKDCIFVDDRKDQSQEYISTFEKSLQKQGGVIKKTKKE